MPFDAGSNIFKISPKSSIQIFQFTTIKMLSENSLSQEHTPSNGHSTEENSQQKSLNNQKSKNIKKERGKGRKTSTYDQQREPKPQLSKDQKKEIQKEKNRVAAQLSRDRQKKYVEDLEAKVNDLERTLAEQLCRKCKARLIDMPSTQEQNDMEPYVELSHQSQIQRPPQDILNEEPEVEPLPFIRVPFEKSDVGFGRIGSFFCISLLLLAVLCFSNSVENPGAVPQERRLMQAITEKGQCQQEPEPIEVNLPTTLTHNSLWSFQQDEQLDTNKACKNDFWESYLQIARQEPNSPASSLVNCNNPALIRISKPQKQENQSMSDQWTFLVSDPTITHAHLSENGGFYIDEVDYMNGVYQMVAEKVVLKKVVGKNCLA